jgi:hypothetical protein
LKTRESHLAVGGGRQANDQNEVSTVAGQISSSVEKDFLSIFYIPLPGYPISYQIDNVTTYCELIFKKNILVFGKYDLVFCYPSTVNELEPVYDTASLTRTFCESILLTGSDTLEMLSAGTIDIQPGFVQPLHVRIKLGKPLNLKPWELLKSFISRKTWVEVFVEGQITAEITPGHYNANLDLMEPLLQIRTTTAEQDDTALQQKEAAINLEALAKQVQKIISQRQEEKPAIDLEAMAESVQKIISQHKEEKPVIDLEALAKQVQKIISQRQEEKPAIDETACRDSGQPGAPKPAIPPVQEQPEVLNAAKVTELVLNILRAREAAMARREQHLPQYPAGMESQANFNVSHPGGAQYPARTGYRAGMQPPAPASLPLEQIPSRPGFEAIIHNPPPKPPGASG